jgi:hypothetical protein
VSGHGSKRSFEDPHLLAYRSYAPSWELPRVASSMKRPTILPAKRRRGKLWVEVVNGEHSTFHFQYIGRNGKELYENQADVFSLLTTQERKWPDFFSLEYIINIIPLTPVLSLHSLCLKKCNLSIKQEETFFRKIESNPTRNCKNK